MKKKILAVGIISMFMLAGFITMPAIGIKLSKTDLEKTLLKVKELRATDDETEYWGVCVVAFDDPDSNMLEPFVYDALLEANNWDESHIKLLFRENSTKEAIINALDWLIENADENDVVLFSDHSHGTRRRDGKYGIVPVDSEEVGIITTDELDEKFDAMKAKELCLIFDCCLAGNFVNKEILGFSRIDKTRCFNKGIIKGLEGENRVVLMSTMRYGLGVGIGINFSGNKTHISFQRFVGEAFNEKIDYNSDGFCSAEEAFQYAKKKWRPYAIITFLLIRFQIQSFLSNGFFIIPFPTLYDSVEGELFIINK